MWGYIKEIGTYLVNNPLIPLFASLGLGYVIARLKVGSFSLGSTVGTLVAAILVSMALSTFGQFEIPSLMGSLFFALFIFAVGYEVGPAFFKSFKSSGVKSIILAPVFAVSGFLISLLLFKLFHIGAGEGAGILAGAFTQSSTVAAADSMIQSVMSASDATSAESKLAAAYAVTYLFGSIGVILLIKLFPKLLHMDLKAEVQKKIIATGFHDSDPDGSVVNSIKVRAYLVGSEAACIGQTIEAQEILFHGELTVEKLMRDGKPVDFTPQTVIAENDRITLIGSLDAMLRYQTEGVTEVEDDELLAIKAVSKELFLTKGFDRDALNGLAKQGVFVSQVKRDGKTIAANGDYREGDELTLAGPKSVIVRAAKKLGYIKDTGIATDVIFLSVGIALGLVLGAFSVTVAGIPIGLGSGGGALVMGLVFGWYQNRHQNKGAIPSSTRWFLKSVGLNMTMAITGLNAGAVFLSSLQEMGFAVFLVGAIATLVTNLIVFAVAKFVLKMDLVDTLGALCGAGTATAALNAAIDETGSGIFAIAYTPAYALGNVLLTVIGPLAVAILK